MFENDFGDVIKPFVDYTVFKNINGLFCITISLNGTRIYVSRFDLYEAFEAMNKKINLAFNGKEPE